jgi:hypothetical protein
MGMRPVENACDSTLEDKVDVSEVSKIFIKLKIYKRAIGKYFSKWHVYSIV